MIEAFQHHLKNDLSFLEGKKLLLACSGGLDSIVLGYLLKSSGSSFGIAHCNFSLRGTESDEDQNFVESISEQWDVPFYTETFDTNNFAKSNKLSTQLAARALRYQWFEEVLHNFKYDYLLTAHHADDSLETFIINLSRGTGLRGLSGIPEVNQQIIRPMLPFSRAEILSFAKEKELCWREDSSNVSGAYLRNKIRHDVVPVLKGISENWLPNFQKTQEYLKQSMALVQDYTALVNRLVMTQTEEGLAIDLDKLKDLPNTNALLFELLHPYGFTAWEDIQNLVTAQSGKQIFSGSHRLIKHRDVFLLTEIQLEEKNSEKIITKNDRQIDWPIKMSFIPTDKMGYIDNRTIYADSDKVLYPLTLRKWQEGDVFQPFGLKGKKKLSKFFKDEKLSLAAKKEVWILLSRNQIIWIVGHRMDDRFKITPKTQHIVKISVA